VSAPRNGDGRGKAGYKRENRKEIYEFLLAAIKMIATVVGPVGPGRFWKSRAVFAKIALTKSEEKLD
jgi:hypothetical protein